MLTDIRWRVYRRNITPAMYIETIAASDRRSALTAAQVAHVGALVDVIAEVTWLSLSDFEKSVFLGTFVSSGEKALAAIETTRQQRRRGFVAADQRRCGSVR